MNNLDFSNQPLFSWYVVLLAISGIAMVILGAFNIGRLKAGWRIINIIAGAGFAGYAYYLGFVFEGGEYRIFFQAFILPVLLIANAVKAAVNRGSAPAAAPRPNEPLPAPAPYDPNAQPLRSSPTAPPALPAPAAPPAQPVADNPYAQPQQPPHAG